MNTAVGEYEYFACPNTTLFGQIIAVFREGCRAALIPEEQTRVIHEWASAHSGKTDSTDDQ